MRISKGTVVNKASAIEQIRDLFLLRMREPEGAERPYYTTGSIVGAALLRLAVLATVLMLLNERYGSTKWWWTVALFSLWGIGAYPAWVQYRRFNDSVDKITEGTLCGSCRHFDPTNQLCMVLDEHVTSDAPPCEGEAWEPK